MCTRIGGLGIGIGISTQRPSSLAKGEDRKRNQPQLRNNIVLYTLATWPPPVIHPLPPSLSPSSFVFPTVTFALVDPCIYMKEARYFVHALAVQIVF